MNYTLKLSCVAVALAGLCVPAQCFAMEVSASPAIAGTAISIVSRTDATQIIIDPQDFALVKVASDLFASDVDRVTGPTTRSNG